MQEGAVVAGDAEFWGEKFERTVERDKENRRKLKKLGWQELTIWECEIKDLDKLRGKIVAYFSE